MKTENMRQKIASRSVGVRESRQQTESRDPTQKGEGK